MILTTKMCGYGFYPHHQALDRRSLRPACGLAVRVAQSHGWLAAGRFCALADAAMRPPELLWK